MDRYVAAAVVGAYLAALSFLVAMFVVFDLLFNLGDYMQQAHAQELGTLGLVWMLGVYHLCNLPFVFVTVAPFVSVIACMFALSRLMAANEVGPMIFTGRSMFRVLRPMIAVAAISGLAMVATWQWVVPHVAEERDRLQAVLTGSEADMKQITMRSKGNERKEMYCRVYRHGKQSMEGVILYDRGATRGDGVYVEAESAQWNPEKKDWELVDGRRITGEAGDRLIEKQEWLGMEGLTPDLIVDLGKARRETSGLSYTELADLIRLRPGKPDFVLAYHVHFTFPLANLVLILLALPFAVNFERGRRIERVIFAIAICAGYLIMDLTCQNLAYKLLIHPIVAAWTPTIFFGSLGVVVFGGMRS